MSTINPGGAPQDVGFEVNLEDMKRFQYLQEQLVRTTHMIKLNRDVIKSMACLFNEVQEYQTSCSMDNFQVVPSTHKERIKSIARDHKFLLRNSRSLQKRTRNLSAHVREGCIESP